MDTNVQEELQTVPRSFLQESAGASTKDDFPGMASVLSLYTLWSLTLLVGQLKRHLECENSALIIPKNYLLGDLTQSGATADKQTTTVVLVQQQVNRTMTLTAAVFE